MLGALATICFASTRQSKGTPMTAETDLRIVKTLEAVHASFEKLATEKHLSDITVAELCREARIGKKTFYRHYPSLGSLANEYLEAFFEAFLANTESLGLPEQTNELIPQLVTYLCTEGNANPVYECLVCGSNSAELCHALINRLTELQRINTRKFGRLSAAEISLTLVFVANTAITLYQQWVSEGKHLSAKRLAELSRSLVSGEESLRK